MTRVFLLIALIVLALSLSAYSQSATVQTPTATTPTITTTTRAEKANQPASKVGSDSDTIPQWLAFGVAVLGALAWLPFLFEVFKPVKLKGKLIGWASQSQRTDFTTWNLISNSQLKRNGILYMPQLYITSLNGDFSIARIEASITYVNDANKCEGKVTAFPAQSPVNVTDSTGGVSQMTLKLPTNEQAPLLSVILKNEVRRVFIPFIVDKADAVEPESITFRFYNYRNKHKDITIDFATLDWFAMPPNEYIVAGQASTTNQQMPNANRKEKTPRGR